MALAPPAPPSPTKKSSQELPFYPIETPHHSVTNHNHITHTISTAQDQDQNRRDDITLSIIADAMDVDSGTVPPRDEQQQQQHQKTRAQLHTPELQTAPQASLHGHANHANHTNSHSLLHSINHANHPSLAQQSPNTPGSIPPFDWEEFEARYEQALAEMNGEEKELLAEFDRLVNYFNVWASAAAAHDDERAIKRLQTRERYVKIAEQTLGQRKQHLTEVVRAFQSALALLSQS